MEMSKERILAEYRQAKDKKKQIGILADLNACDQNKIMEILKEMGVPHRELPRNRGANVTPAGEVIIHDFGEAKAEIPPEVAKLLKERVAMIESERSVIDSNIRRMEERQADLQKEAMVLRNFLGLAELHD